MEKEVTSNQCTKQQIGNEAGEDSDSFDEAPPPGESYRLLPLFEKESFNRKFIHKYSMLNNKKLRCGWQKFKDTYGRAKGPAKMPNNVDMHFHNQMVKFYPASSIRNYDHRMKMKPGPGVDHVGQKPIPNDFFMKRGTKIDLPEHTSTGVKPAKTDISSTGAVKSASLGKIAGKKRI